MCPAPKLKKRYIALFERIVATQEWQPSIMTLAVGAMEEYHRVLNSILALVSFICCPDTGPGPTSFLAAMHCPATCPSLSPRPVSMGRGPMVGAAARVPCP